jgi:selenocysteine lyase/cysteine desulfurase
VAARHGIASLIGANEGDVSLTTGASAGLAQCAHAFPWQAGDEVAIVAGDFPSHHATWAPWAARARLDLRVIRPRSRVPGAVDIVAGVSARTRVLSLSHVRFDDGSLLDMPTVAEACRRHGTLLVLDVSQSCGALPIDVAQLGADVLVCAGYKYLLGPWGSGFMWASARAQEMFAGMPCNWLAQSVTTFRQLEFDAPVLRADASRWDAAESNTPFNFNLSALAASVDFVVQAGVSTVHAHIADLLATLRVAAGDEVSWITPAQAGAFGPFLCLEAATPAEGQRIHETLKAGGIVTALRNGRVRIAPHLLHTREDMQRVARSLHASLHPN